jgi:hypothetical protein
LWGWSDRIEQSRTGHTQTDVNIRIAPEDLSNKLREYGLPDYVFGVDKPAPEPKLIEGNGLDHPKLAQEPGLLGDDDDGHGGDSDA